MSADVEVPIPLEQSADMPHAWTRDELQDTPADPADDFNRPRLELPTSDAL